MKTAKKSPFVVVVFGGDADAAAANQRENGEWFAHRFRRQLPQKADWSRAVPANKNENRETFSILMLIFLTRLLGRRRPPLRLSAKS
ncbi:MAG: hypothetical protein K8L99_02335 [Anaerolineae bacterium]|nr:hypothetical protein [Anaerolineae bacterium]